MSQRARFALGVGLVLLLVLPLLLGGAWRSGNEIADAMAQVRRLVSVSDPDELPDALEHAEAELERAHQAASGWSWRLVGNLPILGRSVRITDAAVELADVAHALGADAAQIALDAREAMDATNPDPAALARARDAFAGLDTRPLTSARDRLAVQPTGMTPAAVRAGRQEALGAADTLLEGLDRGQDAMVVASELLGVNGQRQILLGIQNPGELRGTGGLMGQLGVLHADDAEIELEDVFSYSEVAWEEGDFPQFIDPPADFAARYGSNTGETFFGNVNLDPDLPTVGPRMLDIFQSYRNERPDLVVLVDPIALQLLLEVTGPVQIPAEVAGPLPTTIDADEVARVALVDAYVELGGDSEERRQFLGVLAAAVFERLSVQDLGTQEGLAAVTTAVRGRHLQVWSSAPEVQQAVERLGAAGVLPIGEGPTDVFAVTASNAGANKQDVHVSHGFEIEVVLGAPSRVGEILRGSRQTSYGITVENCADGCSWDVDQCKKLSDSVN